MSVATVGSGSPSVFEADLPTISYEDAPTPDAAHRAIRQAQQQGPIAMGAHVPTARPWPGSAGHHIRAGVGLRDQIPAERQRCRPHAPTFSAN